MYHHIFAICCSKNHHFMRPTYQQPLIKIKDLFQIEEQTNPEDYLNNFTIYI